MHLDLTDEEARALARHLRDALDYSRYPFAPRRDPLKAILAKLDPPKPRPATVAAAASERRPPRRARSAAVRSNAHTHGRKPKLTDHQKREAIYGTLIQGKWNESETFEYRHASNTDYGLFACIAKLRRGLFIAGFTVTDANAIVPDDNVDWMTPDDPSALLEGNCSPLITVERG